MYSEDTLTFGEVAELSLPAKSCSLGNRIQPIVSFPFSSLFCTFGFASAVQDGAQESVATISQLSHSCLLCDAKSIPATP